MAKGNQSSWAAEDVATVGTQIVGFGQGLNDELLGSCRSESVSAEWARSVGIPLESILGGSPHHLFGQSLRFQVPDWI